MPSAIQSKACQSVGGSRARFSSSVSQLTERKLNEEQCQARAWGPLWLEVVLSTELMVGRALRARAGPSCSSATSHQCTCPKQMSLAQEWPLCRTMSIFAQLGHSLGASSRAAGVQQNLWTPCPPLAQQEFHCPVLSLRFLKGFSGVERWGVSNILRFSCIPDSMDSILHLQGCWEPAQQSCNQWCWLSPGARNTAQISTIDCECLAGVEMDLRVSRARVFQESAVLVEKKSAPLQAHAAPVQRSGEAKALVLLRTWSCCSYSLYTSCLPTNGAINVRFCEKLSIEKLESPWVRYVIPRNESREKLYTPFPHFWPYLEGYFQGWGGGAV